MKLEKIERYKKYCSIIGAHFIMAPMSFLWVYGNLSEYMDSYFRYSCSPGCMDVDSEWILAVMLAMACPGTLVSKHLAEKIGLKWAGVASSIALNAALFGSAWTVRVSIAWTTLLLGVVLGSVQGITNVVSFQHVRAWAPQKATLFMATTSGASTLLSMIQNQVITAVVNPNNLKPDAMQDSRTFFSQPEVLDRVPTVLIVYAAMTLGLQGVGYLLLVPPPQDPGSASLSKKSPAGLTSDTVREDDTVTGSVTEKSTLNPLLDPNTDASGPGLETHTYGSNQESSMPPYCKDKTRHRRHSSMKMRAESCKTNEDLWSLESLLDSNTNANGRDLKVQGSNQVSESTTHCNGDPQNGTHDISQSQAEYCLTSKEASIFYHSQDLNTGATEQYRESQTDGTAQNSSLATHCNDSSCGTAQNSILATHCNDSSGGGEQNKSKSNVKIHTENLEKEPHSPSESMQTSLKPSEVLKTSIFYAIFMFGVATVYALILKANFYKQFGLLYIHDDRYLTLVGTLIPVIASLSRLATGMALNEKVLSIKQVLLYSLAVNSFLCAFWYFVPQVNAILYLIFILCLAVVQSLYYVTLPVAAMEMFGPAHFATNYGLLLLTLVLVGLLGPVVMAPIMNVLGWFWLFGSASFLCLVAMVFVICADFKPLQPSL